MSASIENSLKDIAKELKAIRIELHKLNNPLEGIQPVQITLDTKPDNSYQE